IGPFELLEARRIIEGEAAALAALRIDDDQLRKLSELIAEMRDDNKHNEILMSEEADRRFHELIASSTQNSGIIAAVQMLWDARARSPQSHLMDDKSRARDRRSGPPLPRADRELDAEQRHHRRGADVVGRTRPLSPESSHGRQEPRSRSKKRTAASTS